MLRVRQIGLVVLAVAAILVFFAMKPEEAFQPGVLPSTGAEASDYTNAIDEALATYELNDANADTAPKQRVVNGWMMIISVTPMMTITPPTARAPDVAPWNATTLTVATETKATINHSGATTHIYDNARYRHILSE